MRVSTFTFRMNADERRILAVLAEHLQRSRSDAVRLLIRTAARELSNDASDKAQGILKPALTEVVNATTN